MGAARRVSVLEARAVTGGYGRRVAVAHVSCAVARGELISIVGPNGGGKTTLVRLMMGLIPPWAGHVVRAPHAQVGYVPQDLPRNPLLPLTVRGFLDLFDAADGAHGLHRLQGVDLGVSAWWDHPITHLSKGQWQRVLLTRALACAPDVLVLDEPTQGLDGAGQADFYRLIQQVRRALRCGIIVVSHDVHWVMAETDKVYCINGHVCCAGAPDVVQHDPAYHQAMRGLLPTGLWPYRHHHDHVHTLSDQEPL